MFRMSYVRISEIEQLDTCLPLNLESGIKPGKSFKIPEPEPISSEVFQTLDPKLGQGSDLKPPTHHKQYSPSNPSPPGICDLMYVRQQSQETVHHFWARFLLVKDKIKDCRNEDTIAVFCNNCTDEEILNAINHRSVLHSADLATIVQKYCAMESAWKTQTARWEPPVSTQPLGRAKRMHPRGAPDPIVKKTKPIKGRGTVLEG